MTRTAMQHLLDRIGDTVAMLGPFGSRHEEADAHRHLLRLTSAALDLFVERADPARPLPTEWMSPTRKFLGDSPDTIYTTVPVSAAHPYRLAVGAGNALYTGVVVYGRHTPGGPVHIVDSAIDRDLTLDEGRFTLDIGAHVEPGDTAGLHLDDSAFWVMVRQYFADPFAKRGGEITVERVDGVSPDGPPDPDGLEAGIEAAAAWIAAQARADVALDGLMRLPEGSRAEERESPEVPEELVSLFFPTPDIDYQGCRLALADDEQLRIDLTPPPCRFWSVVLTTPWLESVEQRVTPASISSERCVTNPDGSVTVVVSEHDPGAANWIPLRGYRKAQVAYRVLLAEATPPEARFAVERSRPPR